MNIAKIMENLKIVDAQRDYLCIIEGFREERNELKRVFARASGA